jgi:hypothetical protein
MSEPALPFTYMLPAVTKDVCGFGTTNSMQRATREGRFIQPDYINGRARYRSDRVAEWLREQARKADEAREDVRNAAVKKGQSMRAARRDQAPG